MPQITQGKKGTRIRWITINGGCRKFDGILLGFTRESATGTIHVLRVRNLNVLNSDHEPISKI